MRESLTRRIRSATFLWLLADGRVRAVWLAAFSVALAATCRDRVPDGCWLGLGLVVAGVVTLVYGSAAAE